MQSVIVHPGVTDVALSSPEARALVRPDRIQDVVLPSATLSATERVGVYHDMYLLRMEEALETDYPALAHFLGPKRWRDVVRGYVEVHPSRGYTLNVLGRHLPDHVGARPGLRHAAFCRDLARLEWAITEAFDAEEAPRLDESAISAVAPEDWERARLVPSASLRLLDLQHNALAYLDSTKGDEHDHPRPRRRPEWVAVSRRDFRVVRLGLERAASRLLGDLVSGRPVGEAVERCLRASRPRPSGERVFGWFREWARAGVFQAVEL